MYTKQQVEELLAKQRELCAEKARMSGYDTINGKTELFIEDEYTIVDKEEQETIYVQINIDRNSILNAKLEI